MSFTQVPTRVPDQVIQSLLCSFLPSPTFNSHSRHFLGLLPTTLLYLNTCLGAAYRGANLSRSPFPHWDKGQLLMVTDDGNFIGQGEEQGTAIATLLYVTGRSAIRQHRNLTATFITRMELESRLFPRPRAPWAPETPGH